MSSTTDLHWFKSSYSSAQGDSCIEVAEGEQGIHVRDSKDITRSHLTVGRAGWALFVRFAAGG